MMCHPDASDGGIVSGGAILSTNQPRRPLKSDRRPKAPDSVFLPYRAETVWLSPVPGPSAQAITLRAYSPWNEGVAGLRTHRFAGTWPANLKGRRPVM